MTLARTFLIILVSANVGVLPLVADNGQGPGGDGGVVILPGSTDITNGTGTGPRESVSVTVVVSGEDSIRLRLPDRMLADATTAVIYLPEGGIMIPLRTVAGEIEIDADTVSALIDQGVDQFRLWIVSSNSRLLDVTVTLKYE